MTRIGSTIFTSKSEWVREIEGEKALVWARDWLIERERECVCVCARVCVIERERERVCVCVCVSVRRDLDISCWTSMTHRLCLLFLFSLKTYAGLFLVIVNPYTRLPLYNQQLMGIYAAQARDKLPPHVYSVADEAYRGVLVRIG